MKIEEERLVQIKLVTGQEILAQKLESTNESDFDINCALEMVAIEIEDPDLDESLKTSYYILRPFISYPERLDTVITVNPTTIVTINLPSKKVISQYMASIFSIQEMLTDACEKEEKEEESGDSSSNVLSFPSSPKLLTED